MQTPTPKHQATLSAWVAIYRERGLQPLPSRMNAKRPLVMFSDCWERPYSGDPFDPARWCVRENPHPPATTNVQVMTGRTPWRLLVIDLDGEEARGRWASLGGHPPTWTVTSGGKGRHLWFRLSPEQCRRPLPKAFLWRGEDRHNAIERLCDRSLVMAPPSIHPKTGAAYTWTSRRESPLVLNLPALCPAWVLELPPVQEPRATPPPRTPHLPPLHLPGDVLFLARSWGLRLAGNVRPSGWAPCHAIGREDTHPSAAIHATKGIYVDQGSGERLSLPDLAVRLGAFHDRIEAYRSLKHHAR